jgi:hypothetical protein
MVSSFLFLRLGLTALCQYAWVAHHITAPLEALETQSTAILQLLKDKGVASGPELALHLEQAGNASSVRWRAAQVRIDHLVSSALKTAEREAKQQPPKLQGKNQESLTDTSDQASGANQGDKEIRNEQQDVSGQKSGDTPAEKNQSKQAKENENEGSGEDARKKAA